VNDTILTIVGNVVDVPNRRVLDSGSSVTTFRVASSARRFDKERGQWVDGDSVFARVTCWRQLGDNVFRSLVKGDPVVLTGRFFTRSYEKDGQRRSSYELEATAVGHDLTRGTSAFHRTVVAPSPAYEVVEVDDEDETAEPVAAGVPADHERQVAGVS